MILLWIIAFGVISFPFDYDRVGKYYLGDVGYGVCYHLKEFSDNPPRNDRIIQSSPFFFMH